MYVRQRRLYTHIRQRVSIYYLIFCYKVNPSLCDVSVTEIRQILANSCIRMINSIPFV